MNIDNKGVNMKTSTIAFVIFFVVFALSSGFYSISEFDPEIDKGFDAEYLSGVLTASVIIFGLWGIVLQMEPKRREEPIYMSCIEIFLVCVFFLIASVMMVMVSGLGFFSPMVALVFSNATFVLNAVFFAVTVYIFKYVSIKSQYKR